MANAITIFQIYELFMDCIVRFNTIQNGSENAKKIKINEKLEKETT